MTLPTAEEIAEDMYAHVPKEKRSYAASVGVLCAKDATERAFRAVAKELREIRYKKWSQTAKLLAIKKLQERLEGEKVTR